MALWDSYLQDTPWEQADNKERARILLYEYGYIPYLFSVGDTATCSRHYDRYIQHIEQHKEQLPHAAYCAYRSAGHAYAHMLKKGGMMDAIRSLRLAQEAVKSDSLQPLVLYNRGNVYYHAPSFVGGSKRKALDCFRRAQQLAEADSTTATLWIHPAICLTIAQCYEAIGNPEQALRQCRDIQNKYSSFRFVNEEYIPKLLHH